MADAKLGRAVIEIVVDGDKMSAAFAKGQQDTQAFADRVGKGLENVGSRLTTAISLPLAAVAVASVKAASDTAESLNKMQVVFGKSAESIQTWAQGSAKNLAMSRQEAYEATGTFGNLFRALGLGQGDAAKMSMRLVELAADLASFNNLDPAQVLEKLRSGLTGEAEPLKALGININETTVKAEALRLGLVGVGGELTEAAKVQARYSLILQQTKIAQGDLANTADSLSNSTKITTAELKNAAAELGTNLIPLAKEGIDVVNQLAVAFNGLDAPTQKAIVNWGLFAIAMGPALKVLGEIAKVGGTVAKIVGTLSSAGLLTAAVPGLVASGLAEGAYQVSKATGTLGRPLEGIDQDQYRALQAQYEEANAQYTAALAAGQAERAAARKAEADAIKQQIDQLRGLNQAANETTMQGLVTETKTAGQWVAALTSKLQDLGTALLGIDGTTVDITFALGLTTETKTAGEWATQVAQDQVRNVAVRRGMEGGIAGGASAAGWTPAPLAQPPVAGSAADVAAKEAAQQVTDLRDAMDKAKRAASAAVDAFSQKVTTTFDKLATAITKQLDDAANHIKGLVPNLPGLPGAGGIAPGENGAFESLYRIADVAATKLGRAPGKDTAKWAAMYPGLDYVGITQQAAAGNWFAPGVFEQVNWQALAAQTQAQQQSSKVSTYAGQAAAGLLAAGKPLTAENMKQMVDQLAAADKDSIVPNLEDIKTAVATQDTNTQTSLGNVLAALGTIAGLLGPPAPTPPPPPPNGPQPPAGKSIPAYATGTPYHPGGLALVGEVPEIINLPQGASVTPLSALTGAGEGGLADALLGRVGARLAANDDELNRMAGALAGQLGSLAGAHVLRLMLDNAYGGQ